MSSSGLSESARGSLWTAAALALYLLCLATPFREVLREDLSRVVPMYPRFDASEGKARPFWKFIGEAEQRFVAWQVARNARVLIEEPGALFDTEQCHPTKKMMALGEPMIALGVVGVPCRLVLSDPLRTYNAVLLGIILISAMAMYLLVKEWTGIPAAGIVAGLLYAFHPDKIADINHIYIHDTAWTVLALLFVRRFFEHGRWRDAIPFALCCAMQIAGSYYPFVGAALLALPFLVWLLSRYGWRQLAPIPAATALLLIALVGFAVFAPYLEMRSGELLITRSELHFAVWSELLPGGGRFPGWIALGLVLFGLATLRRDTLRESPFLALVAACVLVLLMTVGSSAKQAPALYRLFSGVIPGLDAVRRPNEILSAFHVGFTILAGLGCGALLSRLSGRAALGAALALISTCYLATLRPAWLGLDPPVVYRAMTIRPAESTLAFYEALGERGNDGPILETPRGDFLQEASRVLVSGYHERRTSACVNELQPEAEAVEALREGLPSRESIAGLAAMGFTTIVVHHSPGLPGEDERRQAAQRQARALAQAARRPESGLRALHQIPGMSAYEMVDIGD